MRSTKDFHSKSLLTRRNAMLLPGSIVDSLPKVIAGDCQFPFSIPTLRPSTSNIQPPAEPRFVVVASIALYVVRGKLFNLPG